MRILFLAMLMQAIWVQAAHADAPKRAEAVTKAEQAAYDKAECVYDAITVACRFSSVKEERPINGRSLRKM